MNQTEERHRLLEIRQVLIRSIDRIDAILADIPAESDGDEDFIPSDDDGEIGFRSPYTGDTFRPSQRVQRITPLPDEVDQQLVGQLTNLGCLDIPTARAIITMAMREDESLTLAEAVHQYRDRYTTQFPKNAQV